MDAISTAYEAVLAQLEPMELEAAALQARLDQLDKDKARLKAAAKELKPNKKGRTKPATKGAKPFACKADVQDACLRLLKTNPAISKAELEEQAKHHLAELGFSGSGIPMLLGKCLTSNEFTIEADETVSIASASSSNVVHPASEAGDKQSLLPVENSIDPENVS